MRVATINIDKTMEKASLGLKSLEAGILPEDDFKGSVTDLMNVTEILLERLNRRKLGKKSSEKEGKGKERDKNKGKKNRERNQLPSKRYPYAPIVEKERDFAKPPSCDCCGGKMKDSGLRDVSEQITVIPRQYIIYRFLTKKYKCGKCHMGMKIPPAPARIVPGSSYSDEMVLDVALSKYCDLIPIERQVEVAGRQGFEGLPANSLIGLTHHLANFLESVCQKLREETLSGKFLCADETPHRMLEDNPKKKSHYLWGFSSSIACFFDIRGTRAGEVAGEFLKEAKGKYLLSDVYSGYSKALNDANTYREENGMGLLWHLYCNVHARRKFVESKDNFTAEAKVFLFYYRRIYKIESEQKELKGWEKKLSYRQFAKGSFDAMKALGTKLLPGVSSHSTLAKGINYFINNFEGLTRCLNDPDLPLDNNSQERLLRSSVVGRKTWYGTHSKRGAKTTASIFSVVESCKLNGVNPREYFPWVVQQIHDGKEVLSPHEYLKQIPKLE